MKHIGEGILICLVYPILLCIGLAILVAPFVAVSYMLGLTDPNWSVLILPIIALVTYFCSPRKR
jgi:hypothetical protein